MSERLREDCVEKEVKQNNEEPVGEASEKEEDFPKSDIQDSIKLEKARSAEEFFEHIRSNRKEYITVNNIGRRTIQAEMELKEEMQKRIENGIETNKERRGK